MFYFLKNILFVWHHTVLIRQWVLQKQSINCHADICKPSPIWLSAGWNSPDKTNFAKGLVFTPLAPNPAITDCKRFVHTATPTGIKNTPYGAFFIPGGVRYFYGLLHTTSGNLQGKFVIFVPETNFAPRPSRIFSTSRKKFPKQIIGNLFKKTLYFCWFSN